jgi:hypothetical protein
MQFKNWFDRKKIALLGLLFIVLVSLIDPIPNISEAINREINLNKARNYNCLAEHIPAGEDILFIGNPLAEPPFSINLAFYYRSQFFLAPRLVVLMDSLEVMTSTVRYSWFISNDLDDGQLREVEGQYGLTPVKKCGDFILLQRPAQQ